VLHWSNERKVGCGCAGCWRWRFGAESPAEPSPKEAARRGCAAAGLTTTHGARRRRASRASQTEGLTLAKSTVYSWGRVQN
jgi:hypothetical protein